MEQMFLQHPWAFVLLVLTVGGSVGSAGIVWGRLTKRLDDHQDRIEELEEKKVPRDLCKLAHKDVEQRMENVERMVFDIHQHLLGRP